jgi:membrane-associated phospholipid phosphatase
MTAADNSKHDAGAGAQTVLRRCLANIETALSLALRPPRVRAPWPMSWPQIAIAAGVVVVLFVFGMVFLDAATIRAVGRAPRWLNWCFNQITDYGKSGWFLWPLGLLFIALAALPTNVPRMAQLVLAAVMVRVGFLFAAIAVPGLFVAIVKRMIGRARPMVGGHIDPYLFHPFIWRTEYASLPSGHATTAFSVLVAFGSLYPRARTVLWIYALAIAASRVMVNVHNLTDVLAGALFGTVGAMMVRRWFALRRLGFSFGPDGTLHQWPGPSARRLKALARALLAE